MHIKLLKVLVQIFKKIKIEIFLVKNSIVLYEFVVFKYIKIKKSRHRFFKTCVSFVRKINYFIFWTK